MTAKLKQKGESSNTYLKKTLRTPSIDSLKLRIPFERVEVVSLNLGANVVEVNIDTGEQLSEAEYKKNALKLSENGITVRYAIERQRTRKGIVREFLTIGINSKILKERYFEGITKGNILLVYNYLIDQKVALFEYMDLLEAECTDVDIKKDTELKDFRKHIPSIDKNTKPSKKKGRGSNTFRKSHNVGIEFSVRTTTEAQSNPFVKIYQKHLELYHNSIDFFREYIEPNYKTKDIEHRVRIETTVKNKKHFRYFDIEDTTLNNLLNLSEQTLNNIIKLSLHKHMQPIQRTIQIDTSKVKANDIMIYTAIDLLLQQGISFERISDLMVESIENRSQKSKKRAYLKVLYDLHIEGTEADIETKELDQFYMDIGLIA